MVSVEKIKEAQSVEDLQELGVGSVFVDVGGRGGGVGFYGKELANAMDIHVGDLPGKFGAYSNYLGGGLRGVIQASGFNSDVPKDVKEVLLELGKACIRVYENLENEAGLNDVEDEDGEVNWEALGSKASRNAGIVSAY